MLHLQGLATMSGEITFSKEAGEFFDSEYKRFYYSPIYDDAQFSAYASRRSNHLLKVAMCLMAAEGGGMELKMMHLNGAKILLEDVEQHMRTVFDRIAMTEGGTLTEEVYRTVRTARVISRADLLKKLGHKMSAQELSKIMETLVLSRRVRMDTEGGQVSYHIKVEDK